MFQDMEDVSGGAFEILRAKARTRLEQWIDNRNYIGWLATPVDEPGMIVAGAGVQLQPILPGPLDVSTIGEGRQGTIVNVFTEPQWRQRGISGRLVKEIIAWSKNECLDRLLLHASDDGALSLRTARIHRRQRNVFRRRFLVLPLDDAQSVSEFAETSFIVAWVGDAMM
jgi:GNAT superfamily N-acetyltransferase